MLDLKYIRGHPDEVKEALIKRNEMAPIDEILELDERRRTLLVDVQGLKHQRNVTSKEISRMKEKDQVLIEEMRRLGDEIKALDQEVKSIEEKLNRLLLQLPNLPHPSVPVGKDESENIIVRQEGEPREFDFEPLPHWDLGPTLGIIDFERGVKLPASTSSKGWGPGCSGLSSPGCSTYTSRSTAIRRSTLPSSSKRR
jgi:seryl-tRNA synthetase